MNFPTLMRCAKTSVFIRFIFKICYAFGSFEEKLILI